MDNPMKGGNGANAVSAVTLPDRRPMDNPMDGGNGANEVSAVTLPGVTVTPL